MQDKTGATHLGFVSINVCVGVCVCVSMFVCMCITHLDGLCFVCENQRQG